MNGEIKTWIDERLTFIDHFELPLCDFKEYDLTEFVKHNWKCDINDNTHKYK